MRQPLIHGKYSITALVQSQREFDKAVSIIVKHFAELKFNSPKYPPIVDGLPETSREGLSLRYSSTDDFWLYRVDMSFWENLAKQYPEFEISLDYASVFLGEKCGTFHSKNGLIESIVYEDGSMDAIEFSKAMNGCD